MKIAVTIDDQSITPPINLNEQFQRLALVAIFIVFFRNNKTPRANTKLLPRKNKLRINLRASLIQLIISI